jgi:hypothetical protein
MQLECINGPPAEQTIRSAPRERTAPNRPSAGIRFDAGDKARPRFGVTDEGVCPPLRIDRRRVMHSTSITEGTRSQPLVPEIPR